MQQAVKARHTKLTAALRSYVETKLIGPVSRVFDDAAAKLDVHLEDAVHAKAGRTEQCRVHLVMPAGRDIVITEHDADMYKAIDRVHDRLLEQVKRGRERQRDGHHRRKVAAKERALTARQQLTAEADEPEEWERETALYEASQALARPRPPVSATP